MAVGFPSGTNTYVPNHAASQSLVVGYSRSARTFKIPDYTQYVRAKNNQGLYLVWTSRQAGRILTPDAAEANWHDGDVAPTGENNEESTQYLPFITRRKAFAYKLGRMAVEQASYPVLAAHAGMAAQQAMTARTMLTYNAISTASWGSATIAIDNGLFGAGHNWKTGSVGYNTGVANDGANIKVSFQYAENVVNLLTLGSVRPEQMTAVFNPATAQAMAASTEIQDYVKQSEFAKAQLRGDVPNQNGMWGLPTMLYGHKITVEDTVRVASKKGSVDSLLRVIPDGEAYFLAREGELEGFEGSRSFSTVQIFFYIHELTAYSKYDGDNERYIGRVVTDFQPVVVTTYSGFRFTKCLG